MKYTDCVYGEFEISEPVILDLINCPSLQRLKEIDSAGYFEPYFPGVSHSRFAHSMGVFCLLRKYGAPLEEQIAGLIHDVSHSAFSHCIDYVLDSGSEKEQSHQDNLFVSFVRKTEIPEIIKRYGFDLEYILNDKNFPLKEKELPDLCADRIDYSLRNAVVSKWWRDRNKIDHLLDNLVAENGHWLFKNFESAKKFTELFLKMNTEYYSGLASAVQFRTVGDYLRHALQEEYINEDDLYTTDKAVVEKVNKFLDKDEKLRLLWERMNNRVRAVNNPDDFDAQVFCKSRAIDPWCKREGALKRVSEIDPKWREILERESKPKKYFLKFEK